MFKFYLLFWLAAIATRVIARIRGVIFKGQIFKISNTFFGFRVCSLYSIYKLYKCETYKSHLNTAFFTPVIYQLSRGLRLYEN